ncbi:MAG: hypothetical protein IH571_03565, partial [Acholeplasmataceae bacterium]|nr:hypothetical protein [Acholeplasmataceae bacterium]
YFKGIKKVIQNIHDALSDEGRFIFDVYKEDVLITYDNFVESENEPMPYVWKIKVKNKMLKHTVETNQQQDVIYQYVHPLTYVVSILEEIGFHAEIHTGPDSRKYYIIAFK